MAEYDEKNRRLTIKLVYYGPALSGKTTNLMRLHDLLSPQLKGEMMMLETQNDRTLFFDLLPLGFSTPAGAFIKFKLFTVPGQVAHDSTRKAVLSRADGVVFVADSQNNQSVNNAESFQNLADNTKRVGIDIEAMPLVVQFNKRDLPDIVSEEEIRQRWSAMPWPLTMATATQGRGVVESFMQLMPQVYVSLDRHFGLAGDFGLDEAMFLQSVQGDSA